MNSTARIAIVVGLLAPVVAAAQAPKQQIAGSWKLVSLYNEDKDGKRHPYGDKPVGLTIYDRSGHVVQYLSKPGAPKFANANRLKGTDKEYRAVMESTLAGFGTYTVDGNTVTIRWVASTFPNRIGTTEKRTYQLAGNELVITNPTAASGGTSYARYARAEQ